MAREIRIQYHYEPDGAWWADSPDLERFTAAGETFHEVRRQAREGAEFVSGEPVMIVEDGVPTFVRVSHATQGSVPVVFQFQGTLRQVTGAWAIPTVVPSVGPVPADELRREGALYPETVA